MSTLSNSTSRSRSPAPWKPIFKEHITNASPHTESPEFYLSTISAPEPGKGIPFPTPRLRTLVFRGFWLELPKNANNPHWGMLNSAIRARHKDLHDGERWESECLTFTTDARMHKATSEIFYSPPGADEGTGSLESRDILCAKQAQSLGVPVEGRGEEQAPLIMTGGGAWVEACFWVKEPPAQTQWRVGGRCYLLAIEDIENTDSPHVREVRRRIEERVWPPKGVDLNAGAMSYREELLAHFSNLSPGLRASFAGGEGGEVDGSGVLRSGEPLPKGYKLPEKVQGFNNEESVPEEFGGVDGRRGEVARRHFRLGVIVPERVDRVDLGKRGGAGRRWVYTLEREGQGAERWVEREVWP